MGLGNRLNLMHAKCIMFKAEHGIIRLMGEQDLGVPSNVCIVMFIFGMTKLTNYVLCTYKCN